MNPILSVGFLRIRLNMRRALSLLAAEAVLLSVFHHWLDFWGLPWDKQVLLILVGGPILAFLISFLLTPVWNDLLKIEWRRWLLFFFPALMIASAVAWQLFSVPEVQHQLAIIPVGIDAPATIQISELKAAYGNVIPLSSFTNFAGWTMKDNGLLVGDTSADPIHYSFNGPIDQQVRVTFLTSPDSGSVKVVLDGNVQNIDLRGSIGDQRRARMDTQYLWGSLNFLIGPIIVSADLLTVLFLLTSIWMIQEIAQRHSVVSEQRKPDAFLSHRDGLLILCSLALVFHVVNFFAVPLTVFIKDSPSYLQGVAYWIRFHSLDGVSSFRGPGTTFLFIPVVAPFGKSPLGLKFLLHFLAFACIPINYRIGWQVGGRRWFAFFAGLLTILMPDLYLYSNMVVSEIPHVFFELLFITTLISALETMSFAWMVIALLVGSFSVLVRSESAVSLILGIVFLFVNILRETMIQQEALPYNHKDFLSNSFNHLWRFGLAILVAGAPLLVWSIHNEKIYGFFGVSNYLGEILFDGWIYYGQNSHIPIVDPNSPAVHDINSVYPLQPDRMKNVPTGWAYYRFLLRHGYTGEQAFSLLGQAAIDS